MIRTERLIHLRAEYPNGTRVELLQMNDPYTSLVPGDQGTVTGIDDNGTVFVNWDKGSSLGLVYEEDQNRKVTGV